MAAQNWVRTIRALLETSQVVEAARNEAFLAAERERHEATYEAEVEYSETVLKLRERFEADLAAAAARRLDAVTPAHRAYNRAVVAAEAGIA